MSWLIAFVTWLVGIAGSLAFATGAGLLLFPAATLRASALFGGFDPVTRLAAWLDRQTFVERFVYRRHKVFGAFVIFGALYASFRLFDAGLPALKTETLGSLFLLGAVRFLWLSNAFLVLVGLVIFIRPSLLKGLEKGANRWVSLGLSQEWKARAQPRLARLLEAAPRRTGAALIAVGIYLFSLVAIS